MGRTTADENKSDWIRFRIKPSLRKKILDLQAQGDCSEMDLKDYLVVLIKRGLRIQEALTSWQDRLTIDAAKEERDERRGGAARRDAKEDSPADG